MQRSSYQDAVNTHSGEPAIHTYRLKFFDDRFGPHKDIEFKAATAAKAISIAQSEASNQSVELWCDGSSLCTLKRTNDGVWQIRSSANRSSSSGRKTFLLG